MPKPPEYSSDLYKQHRPEYPSILFDIIFEKCSKSNELAVDVGCGTGQTTNALMKRFKRVVGIDPAQSMLDQAVQGPEYKVGTAEALATLFDPSSIDLITCSTAAHWFVMEDFYAQCFKALKNTGVLAIWAYGNFYLPDYPEVSKISKDFCLIDMAEYWDSRRGRLDRMYTDEDYLTSPFKTLNRVCYDDVDEPCLMKFDWSISQIQGFWSTWSPYKTYKIQNLKAENDIMIERVQEIKKIIKDKVVKVCFPVVLITCTK